MANILLLDESPVAQKAMAGILGRGEHRLATVDSVEQAWKFLLNNVAVDLLIMEVTLANGGIPLNLLALLRTHGLFKTLPVLVYTSETDREMVRKCLGLRVQNYLIKPYSDEKLFGEIRKATEASWRNAHFEEPRSFCAQMNITVDEMRALLERVRVMIPQVVPLMNDLAELGTLEHCADAIIDLRDAAESAGAWGLHDVICNLVTAVEKKNWVQAQSDISAITICEHLITYQMFPDRIPPGFISEEEQEAIEVEKRRQRWLGPDLISRCPLLKWEQVRGELDLLQGFPVVRGPAATFQMAADGRESCVGALSDLAGKDPGLAAQTLLAANALRRAQGDAQQIEDPQQAVQLLGGARATMLASGLATVPETDFRHGNLCWHHFWMYQHGCAQLSAFICEFMEIPIFMPQAYWSALLHDIGKILIVRLYPESLKAAAKLSEERGWTLLEAEQKIWGCTHRDIGAHMALRHNLPRSYASVMRHIGDPESAGEDRELVALVTFASYLARRYKLGYNGEPVSDNLLPLEQAPGWNILRERVFPSFDLARFETLVQRWCTDLRAKLSGHATAVVD